MFDALEGPGSDINLYGYSYGTLLGYWITQIFPERTGKIILDGVVDPSDWALYPPYLGWDLDIADAEATYKGFIEACATAGPSGCSLAKSSTETAANIDARIEGILSSIYGSWNDTNQYSQNEIAEIIFTYLYQVRWFNLIFTNFTHSTSSPAHGTILPYSYPSSLIPGLLPARLSMSAARFTFCIQVLSCARCHSLKRMKVFFPSQTTIPLAVPTLVLTR